MAPPVTPSPHRFVTGHRKAGSPTKDNRPSHASLPQFRAAAESYSSQVQTSSSQFVPTPRFGKTKPASQRPPPPPKPVLAQALRASTRQTETVEDPHDQVENNGMLDYEQAYAVPTTEDESTAAAWTNDVAMSPKRRRLDRRENVLSPERSSFKLPQTPASHFAKAVPRVLHPQTQESISSIQTSAAKSRRPAFLQSSVAPSEPNVPLPDAFSPHRRGQKFVPGGMAATMQQLVLETGQAAAQSRKGQGYPRGEDFLMRVRLEEVRGDGPHTIKASSESGERVNLILAREGPTGAVQTPEVTTGKVVGIRAPSWTLELNGEQYTVAADWKVLH